MTGVADVGEGIRASSIYILTVDGWFESTRDVLTGARYPDLDVYEHLGNGERRLAVSAACEILSVYSTAVFEGVRLGIGAIRTSDDVRVRTWVEPGTPDRFALVCHSPFVASRNSEDRAQFGWPPASVPKRA